MFARVEQDALRDLENPDLSDERRLALMFIAAVRHLHRATAPAAFDARRRTSPEENELCCVSCDKHLRTPAMYCCDQCRDVAKHIRYIRKIIHDERITVPDLQESIGARLLYIGSGGQSRPTGFPSDGAPGGYATRHGASRRSGTRTDYSISNRQLRAAWRRGNSVPPLLGGRFSH